MLDVREWSTSMERFTTNNVHRRAVDIPAGTLRFQSETTLVPARHELWLRERFKIHRNGVQESMENEFVMRCWTSDELTQGLSAAGLNQMATYAGYGERDVTWSDRLVVVARKPAASRAR